MLSMDYKYQFNPHNPPDPLKFWEVYDHLKLTLIPGLFGTINLNYSIYFVFQAINGYL